MTAEKHDANRPNQLTEPFSQQSLALLANEIKQWGQSLGFDQIGISDIDLSAHEKHLQNWLANGYAGEMDYMSRHGSKRTQPDELVPGTLRVITARIDYAPSAINHAENVLNQPEIGYVSRYALGRDYHKVIRKKLQSLATKIEQKIGQFGYRVFTDSAPVMEKALAEKSGLGWIGKHSNLINKSSGSWFFLGEIYTDLELPTDAAATAHCGSCTACIIDCPTNAIVAPFQVDARKCISYLTIELKGSIPEPLRAPMGNRIYGCDDCQLVCPWNKFATPSRERDFQPREALVDRPLEELMRWDEDMFLRRTEGTAIRRIGHERWQRNIAVAMGNALANPITSQHAKKTLTEALLSARQHATELVKEHIDWALSQSERGGELTCPSA